MFHPKYLLVSALALLAPLTAQGSWQLLNPGTRPTARSQCAVTYELIRGQAVLFGGELTSGFSDETWTYKAGAWTQLSPASSPSRRGGHAIAHDPIRQRTVICMGWNGGSYLGDTWVFDGTTWTQASSAAAPAGRDWAAMAYDPGQGKMLFFGGHDYRRHANNGPGAWGDTWTFDGTTWAQLTPATDPGKRFGHVMAYDNNRKAVVMLGGATPGTTYNDMWEFKNGDWSKVSPKTLPGARNFATMYFDPVREVLVLQGGIASGALLNDTWEYDGDDWRKRSHTSQPQVDFHSSWFDLGSGKGMVFGGAIGGSRKTPTDQVWSYGTDKLAEFSIYGAGCAGTAGTPALSGTKPWIGYDLSLSAGPVPGGAPATLILGSNDKLYAGAPLPLNLGFMGAPSCNLLTDLLLLLPMSSNSGTVSWSTPIPGNVSSLIGQEAYLQVYALDQSANKAGLVVTNGAKIKIGAR